jgi:HAD superfamily hydrolase (TIGR01509 family)
MSKKLTAALFDVDGTLVDTNYLHAVTWWQALAQSGYEIPMADIHRVIGMGSDQLLDALLPADRDRALDASITCAHSALYATFWSYLRPLPGAAELLRACKDSGLEVVLASSASPRDFPALRAALAADDAIEAVTSAGDVDRSKPAPDLVDAALKKADVPADGAVFVGDTVWDVRACQRAGVPCIGLLSGGIDAAELTAAGAIAIFADPAALLESTGGRLAEVVARFQALACMVRRAGLACCAALGSFSSCLARTPASTRSPVPLSTSRQYWKARCRTGSVTPLSRWPTTLLTSRPRAASSSTSCVPPTCLTPKTTISSIVVARRRFCRQGLEVLAQDAARHVSLAGQRFRIFLGSAEERYLPVLAYPNHDAARLSFVHAESRNGISGIARGGTCHERPSTDSRSRGT